MEFSAAVETERSQRKCDLIFKTNFRLEQHYSGRLMKKSAVQFGSEEMTPFGKSVWLLLKPHSLHHAQIQVM